MDHIGMAISSLCLIHCLAGPIAMIALPWLGHWIEAPSAHLLFFLLVVPVAFISFYRSYLHHCQILPIILGGIGVLILVLGTINEHYHLLHFHWSSAATFSWRTLVPHITPICGSFFLITAHYLNIKTCTHQYRGGPSSKKISFR